MFAMQAPLAGTRKDRGLALARDKRIKPVAGSKWYVPSQTQASGGYIVDATEGVCTCPDHEETRGKCKHQGAVEFTMRATVTTPDGSEVSVEKTVRVTYTQDWHNYNLAQTHEREHVSFLLKALCEGVQNPAPKSPEKGGQPRLPLSDVIYAATMKVYTGFSARRAATDIRGCAEKGLIDTPMHFNSILNVIRAPETTPLLTTLVEESAAPLTAMEHSLAIDSTGFSTCVYDRWFDHKYERKKKEHKFVKLHAACGTATHVITAVKVTGEEGADSPQLPELVAASTKRFAPAKITADKAYLAHRNLDAIEAVGAVPYIPFKSNSQGEGPAAWRRMFGLFMYKRDEWLREYHARSNVETVFMMIKKKFGGSVRGKVHEAQVNEVLLKCLCHNLSCVTHAMYELGVEPEFWTSERGALQ